MEFDLPKGQSSIIKVIGVGGGGSNAVNHMYNQGIKGVDFIVCNTDRQALDISPVPYKLQLGPSLTEGRGAGSIPEIGMNAAVENIDEIREFLSKETKMVFVTAGMGGGTGTGAAPVIAQVAKELGILTVGIVTVPFSFEGRKRRQQAEDGLENMRENVDTLLVINNERLREISGNLTLGNAFAQADNVLTTAAKGIAEVISVTGAINVDFNDVNTVMKDSGVAIMGSAISEGENRAIQAVQEALTSPLLNDNDIAGAQYVLLNITYGNKEVLMDEISDITDYIQDEAGSTADVIWGHGYDESLGDGLGVTLIATGFNSSPITGFEKAPEKKRRSLEDEVKKEITTPLTQATSRQVEAKVEEEKVEEPYLKVEETPVQEEQPQVEEKKSYNWEVKPATQFEVRTEVQEEEAPVAPQAQETPAPQEEKEVKRYFLDEVEEEETPEATAAPVQNTVRNEQPESFTARPTLSPEEQQRKHQERMERIQRYTDKIKSADGITEIENVPAFKRRQIRLEDAPHSTENPVSRFNVSEGNNDDITLRGNNSFLHDNVD
ncbi:cell division protein FtsZ [Lishizhenia tianjinensis]|uniref:Cell division protein FtsZ n=1 Tax=Lishizhenia tianjinensis TaxID=477690 RepID=A0A1I6ZYW4_9FLAO|nr:cell division protein FtsZ [Lishizhenia tianjinensis]SFT67878.1 cell division protein FtsZ [Lishizhenia tianjinensis]